jgi:hypothetical protein
MKGYSRQQYYARHEYQGLIFPIDLSCGGIAWALQKILPR